MERARQYLKGRGYAAVSGSNAGGEILLVVLWLILVTIGVRHMCGALKTGSYQNWLTVALRSMPSVYPLRPACGHS